MSSHKKRIYLSPPHMSGNEMKYIKEAFNQNWIAPLGPNVDAFEEALAQYCGVKKVAALSSGTAALHLALIMLGVKSGDEVIASTFTFSATINPIIYLGATPVFVDSETATWNMDANLLETAIKERVIKTGKKPKAIIVVHLYGMPADMDHIMEISKKYEIPVIEDAAEALGSRFKGKQVGTFGELGVLSFNGNKIITTSGGGALISNSEEYIRKAKFLATQARDLAPYYQHSQIGYNYRMSNILAGVGRGQMEAIDKMIEKRRDIHSYYEERLEDNGGMKFLKEPDDNYFSNHWLTTILIDPEKTGIDCEYLRIKLEEKNIESRPLWKPMHLQPVFFAYPKFLNGTSEDLFNKGLCLPSGSRMSTEEINLVVESIVNLL